MGTVLRGSNYSSFADSLAHHLNHGWEVNKDVEDGKFFLGNCFCVGFLGLFLFQSLSCQCWCRLLKLVPQDLLLADERRFALGGGCRGHPRRLGLLFANCPYEFLVSKNSQWHHCQDNCCSPLFPFLSASWKRKADHL